MSPGPTPVPDRSTAAGQRRCPAPWATGVTWVVFDVGETLVDETRAWTVLARWLGVTPFTLMGAIGWTVAERRHHHDALRLVRPDWDRIASGRPDTPPGPEDLYPDVADCLRRMRAAGFRVGIAGNQPESTAAALGALGLEVDLLATSSGWGVHKPDPRFFARLVEACGCGPGAVLYVGDRVDNDVAPAARAGMRTVLVRRGPWGHVHATWPEAAAAEAVVDDLGPVADLLGA